MKFLMKKTNFILLNDQKELKTESVSKIKTEKSTFIAKRERQYLDTSNEDRSIWKQYLTLRQDPKALEKEIKITESSISYLRTQLEITEEKYEKEKEHFQKFFDSILDSIDLQRKIDHSGAIVSEDAHKITRKSNMQRLSNVFKPKKFEVPESEFKV